MYYNGTNPEEYARLMKKWDDMTETGYKSLITLVTRLNDHEQYKKGYRDRDQEIVRCKDCWKYVDIHCSCYELAKDENWFCADGERREKRNG